MSPLTEIIFRLFAWVRPLLWYYHRAGHLLEAFLITLERAPVVESLRANPEHRARWEGMIADCEHALDIAIGLRAREWLGHPVGPETRPGLRHKPVRIHAPPGFEALMLRLLRLIARYHDIERLAQLRAQRIKRQTDAAPVLLEADHRPASPPPAVLAPSTFLPDRAFSCAPAPAGLRIRAPP